MIVLIPYINLLNLPCIIKCQFLRNMEPLSRTESKLGGRHLGDMEDSELLESFCYDIHDCCHGGNLEGLQLFSAPELCLMEPKLECIRATWRLRIMKNGSVLITKMATMAAILKIYKSHMLSSGKSD